MAKAKTVEVAETTFEMIPHDQIKPYDEQPRTYVDMDSVADLAESIAEGGQNTPIIVTKRPNESHYILIGGERRWRACGLLSERTGTPFVMKAVIEPYVDEATLFSKAFIDNLHREDMPPLDIAAGLKRLQEGGKTVEEIAKLYGRSVPYVYNYLALNGLDDRVKALMNPALEKRQRLGVTQAITLTKVPDAELQVTLAEEVVASNMSDGDLNIAMIQQAEERGVTLTHAPKKKRDATDQRRVLETFLRNTERWLDRETAVLEVDRIYGTGDGEDRVLLDIEAVNRILTKTRGLKAKLNNAL